VMKFAGKIQYWKPERKGGLAIVYVPKRLVPEFGGLKQRRVRGRINGVACVSSVWPAGEGRLALNVSQKMMTDAGISVGDKAEFQVERT
jgi:hypothetical protein